MKNAQSAIQWKVLASDYFLRKSPECTAYGGGGRGGGGGSGVAQSLTQFGREMNNGNLIKGKSTNDSLPRCLRIFAAVWRWRRRGEALLWMPPPSP